MSAAKMLLPVGIAVTLSLAGVAAAQPQTKQAEAPQPLAIPSPPFYFDGFGGTDALAVHLADTGQGYANAPNVGGSNLADASTAGGVVGVNVNSSFVAVTVVVAPPTADYYVQTRMHSIATPASDVWIGLRWIEDTPSGSATGYYAQCFNQNDGTNIDILVVALPSGTQINGSGQVLYPVADPANTIVRLEAQGSTIRLKLDGVEVWSTTNTEATAAGAPFFGLYPGPGGAPRTYSNMDYFEAGAL